jgi:hypothetical protein
LKIFIFRSKKKENQSRCRERKRAGTFGKNHYEPESSGSAVFGFKISERSGCVRRRSFAGRKRHHGRMDQRKYVCEKKSPPTVSAKSGGYFKSSESQKDEEEAQKFSQYFEWEENLNRMPSHRLLAMLRAESEGFVKTNVGIDKEEAIDFIENAIIKSNNETSEQISLAIKDSYKRLLEPAISNETLQEAKEKADKKAIEIFSENLRSFFSHRLWEKKGFWQSIRVTEAAVK